MNAHERLGRAVDALLKQDPDLPVPLPLKTLHERFLRYLKGELREFRPDGPEVEPVLYKPPRRCGICNETGHNSRRCPQNPARRKNEQA